MSTKMESYINKKKKVLLTKENYINKKQQVVLNPPSFKIRAYFIQGF